MGRGPGTAIGSVDFRTSPYGRDPGKTPMSRLESTRLLLKPTDNGT
jgi:hypothetical protein